MPQQDIPEQVSLVHDMPNVVILEHDVPGKDTIDSLRVQIDQLQAQVQTLITELDRAVRRQHDT